MSVVIHDPVHIKGVRTVALIELAKGLLVIAAGLGVVSLRHKDIWGIAESFLEFFHANPHHHYVGVFINLVYRISDIRLWKIAAVAGAYATLRFIEAFGLWYALPWAEWMAFLSGAIYIPFEFADLAHRPTPLRLGIIVVNTLVVLYMLYLRMEAAQKRHALHKHAESG
jgi:uncharacterized membrane protein (DUF2068 family)